MATFESTIIEFAFIVVAVVGALGSFYLFVQWRHSKTSVKSLVNNIRNRMDDPPIDKAREGCALHGRRAAYVSTSMDGYDGYSGYYYYRHLFACVE